jgi:fluoroquinolone transport system permease protein
MKKILKLAFADFKIIFRDNSLKGFLFLPIILFGLIVWGVPPLVEKYDFLVPYLSLFLVVAVIENTQTFCFISSMVLIDEKETDVAKVYGVVPLSKVEYIVSRFLFPYVFTVFLNVILFIVQPLFEIGFGVNLLISMLAALLVPVYVLSINSIVKNRMEGMIYIKAFNMLVLLPIAAFFVPEKFKHLFGIFPTHWIFQSVENATQGLSIGLMLGIGFVVFTVLTFFVSKSFVRKHFV